MKYLNTEIVAREFPSEITLAINITGCPNNCVGCHSPILREDIGTVLSIKELDRLIKENPGITCVGFMGGDGNIETLCALARYVKWEYQGLKVGWYSGRDCIDVNMFKRFDYVKFGSYQEKYGPLDSPTTNQVMFEMKDGEVHNITKKFLREQ